MFFFEAMTDKGFTLIELLVVIGIVAILSVVVILTVNPAELLRQARDSNRISDLGVLKSALALYLSDVSSPRLAGDYTICYISISASGTSDCRIANGTGAGQGALGQQRAATTSGWLNSGVTSTATSVARNTTGTGWVGGGGTLGSITGPNFTAISAGTPISNLPIDPVNNSTYYYSYVATSSPVLTFKLGAKMESSRYSNGGSGNVESNDGGLFDNVLEIGTNLAL